MHVAAVKGRMAAVLGTSERTLGRVVAWPSHAAIYVGGAALVLMMGLTTADVVLRNLFSRVVPGGMELNGLLMILVALSTLSAVELARGHIRVDLVLQALPPFLRLPVVAGGLLLTLATIVVTGIQILHQTA